MKLYGSYPDLHNDMKKFDVLCSMRLKVRLRSQPKGLPLPFTTFFGFSVEKHR